MSSKSVLLVAAVAMILLEPAAVADTQITGNFGAWSTFAGIANNGKPICGASLVGRDRSIMIKTQGDGDLFVHIFKTGWQIPLNQPVRVAMQIDMAPLFNLTGIGLHTSDGSSGIEVTLHSDDYWAVTGKPIIPEFLKVIMGGQRVQFYFPEGTEQPWEGSLSGSAAAIGGLINCDAVIVQTRPPQATQPYAVVPTQPYVNRPKWPPPTQPYSPMPTAPVARQPGREM